MQVPPELGNGAANAGVSLARLLWFLTPRQAVTLVASLLLERRIILVACDAETVSAAVHAANALLYPFRWQHIYLPLLPLALKVRALQRVAGGLCTQTLLHALRGTLCCSGVGPMRHVSFAPLRCSACSSACTKRGFRRALSLQDYLAAPMPYLVGIQADCLPLLRGMALEETVLVDLDRLGSCTPELGSPGDDYFQLPFARELEDVFEVRPPACLLPPLSSSCGAGERPTGERQLCRSGAFACCAPWPGNAAVACGCAPTAIPACRATAGCA